MKLKYSNSSEKGNLYEVIGGRQHWICALREVQELDEWGLKRETAIDQRDHMSKATQKFNVPY